MLPMLPLLVEATQRLLAESMQARRARLPLLVEFTPALWSGTTTVRSQQQNATVAGHQRDQQNAKHSRDNATSRLERGPVLPVKFAKTHLFFMPK